MKTITAKLRKQLLNINFQKNEARCLQMLSVTVERLETLFEEINAHLFSGILTKPIITVSPDRAARRAYGWCTTWKAWKETSKEDVDNGYYEINICAEYLNRPFIDTIGTMIHEAVHLYNLQRGIKDCSRYGTYHNKFFKQAAETHGLTVEYEKMYGFCRTRLNEDAAKWVDSRFSDCNFNLYRKSGVRGANTASAEQKQSFRKYVCPLCETIIRATRRVNVRCGDCSCAFVENDKNEGGCR
jgi:hypothetical protein